MDYFAYKNGHLFCEEAEVDEIAARYGTPCYIYSTRTILEHYRKLRQAFAFHTPCIICYSVKANSNLSILKLMQKEGAGFDVVSGGELYRVLKVGADPKKIVFAGVGKTDEEILYALKSNILLLNVESEEELVNIDRLAKMEGKTAQVALRVNPDVNPKTHKFITTGKRENKFGIDLEKAKDILKRLRSFPHVKLSGLHIHIGSQIVEVEPYVESIRRLAAFLPECEKAGYKIEWIDMGGGFGIFYKEKIAKTAKEIADAILPILIKTGCKLLLEPGRFIVGNAGILVTKVLYNKESGEKKFVICDAGMGDLIRPVLYNAYHRVWPTHMGSQYHGETPDEDTWDGEMVLTDVVGPICESGDYFAQDRKLPPLKRGDGVAVFSAGAYGYAMSSNYNSHPRPCEILVSGRDVQCVTERESYDDLVDKERIVEINI